MENPSENARPKRVWVDYQTLVDEDSGLALRLTVTETGFPQHGWQIGTMANGKFLAWVWPKMSVFRDRVSVERTNAVIVASLITEAEMLAQANGQHRHTEFIKMRAVRSTEEPTEEVPAAPRVRYVVQS